jgi:hypothetical protein
MNHLLQQISWQQYLSAASAAAIIYYIAVILSCYRTELETLQQRITGIKSTDELQALQYQTAEETALPPAPVHVSAGYAPQDQIISDTDVLAGKLKACITRAADKPFAPAILIPQLKQILQDHQDSAAERPAISHLIVNECEKTGTALLTEEEVDQWWNV